jgi:hypothetical protein
MPDLRGTGYGVLGRHSFFNGLTFIKFRDLNGDMGDQLIEMERCRTFGNVAVVMDAREFQFGPGGMDVGYSFTFRELNPDGMNVPPPTEEPAADDNPPY